MFLNDFYDVKTKFGVNIGFEDLVYTATEHMF